MNLRMPLIEKKLLTLPQATTSSRAFRGNRVQYRVFRVKQNNQYRQLCTFFVDIRIKSSREPTERILVRRLF